MLEGDCRTKDTTPTNAVTMPTNAVTMNAETSARGGGIGV